MSGVSMSAAYWVRGNIDDLMRWRRVNSPSPSAMWLSPLAADPKSEPEYGDKARESCLLIKVDSTCSMCVLLYSRMDVREESQLCLDFISPVYPNVSDICQSDVRRTPSGAKNKQLTFTHPVPSPHFTLSHATLNIWTITRQPWIFALFARYTLSSSAMISK